MLTHNATDSTREHATTVLPEGRAATQQQAGHVHSSEDTSTDPTSQYIPAQRIAHEVVNSFERPGPSVARSTNAQHSVVSEEIADSLATHRPADPVTESTTQPQTISPQRSAHAAPSTRDEAIGGVALQNHESVVARYPIVQCVPELLAELDPAALLISLQNGLSSIDSHLITEMLALPENAAISSFPLLSQFLHTGPYFDDVEEAMCDEFLSADQQDIDANTVCLRVRDALHACEEAVNHFVRTRVTQFRQGWILVDEEPCSQDVKYLGFTLRNKWEKVVEQHVQPHLNNQLGISLPILRLLYLAR
jgi:hypothetical protein